MEASFHNVDEIKELAGCDLLTISPKLLSDLNASSDNLPRKLEPRNAEQSSLGRVTLDQETFEKMHAVDRMAHDS